LGLWALAGCVLLGWQSWYEYGGGRAKPELYGIWSVSEFTADGKPLAPLTTDETRWQRVAFDETAMLTYQKMDGELVQVPVDVTDRTMVSPELEATFTYDRSGPDRLRLDGRLDGRPVTMSLQRVDLNSFTLRNRGFHWVQDYPHFK
jgi:hypothetical protein